MLNYEIQGCIVRISCVISELKAIGDAPGREPLVGVIESLNDLCTYLQKKKSANYGKKQTPKFRGNLVPIISEGK